jgi:hypothetical protein
MSRRCKISTAVEILGASARTIRNKAAAGLIPGAAKPFGAWTFDTALLHAFVAEKEREACQKSPRHQRAATGVMECSTDAFKSPAAPISGGHYGRTIQKLRQIAERKNADG